MSRPLPRDHLRDVEGHVAGERRAVLELPARARSALGVVLGDLGRAGERAEEEAGEGGVEGVLRGVEGDRLLVDRLLQRLVPAVVARADAEGVREREPHHAVCEAQGIGPLDLREHRVRHTLAHGLERDAQREDVRRARDVKGVRAARLPPPHLRRERYGRLVRLPLGFLGRHAPHQPRAQARGRRKRCHSRKTGKKHAASIPHARARLSPQCYRSPRRVFRNWQRRANRV